MTWSDRFGRLARNPALPVIVAGLGALLFLWRLLAFAHTQWAVMDEGLYLYKGVLYNMGVYRPFQDYGPLSNQMPLAFLIPGFIQRLFGGGLRTGRYFAIFLAAAALLALYLTSRRLGGRWVAAVIVWVVALNPATERIYSMAISEGLVACLSMWVMYLSLGEARPTWQLVAASALAGAIIMIRIDMLPLLPLLCLYFLWQYGWKPALVSGLAGLAVLVSVHAPFWPNILRLWAYWIPRSLGPFLAAWQPPSGAPPFWDPQPTFADRVNSFFDGFRFHFVALTGTLTAWILWPARKEWHSAWEYRAAVFLSALIASLLALHAWASLANNYCVSCYPVYTAFYAGLGLLLIALCFKYWGRETSRWRGWVATGAILFLVLGLVYTQILPISHLVPSRSYAELLRTPLPRLRGLKIQPGTVELWALFANKYHLQYEDILNTSRYFPGIAVGILAAILLPIALWLVGRRISRSKTPDFTVSAMPLLLLMGLVLSPSHLLGGGYQIYDCGSDVIRSYETVGAQLAKAIPAGSKVFWMGYSPSALLYLKRIEIFPSQLNGDYSFRLGGDPQTLRRYGWWNEQLGRHWLEEADYILVYQKYLRGWLADALASWGFREVGATDSLAACLPDAQLLIFRKAP